MAEKDTECGSEGWGMWQRRMRNVAEKDAGNVAEKDTEGGREGYEMWQ